MLDTPDARTILAAAIAHLRAAVLPAVADRAAFDLRVALSALELVARELGVDPGDAAAELAALRALLGDAPGDLAALDRLLAENIAAGAIAADSPALIDHLTRVTLAKLAVDQPNYSTYRKHLAEEPIR